MKPQGTALIRVKSPLFALALVIVTLTFGVGPPAMAQTPLQLTAVPNVIRPTNGKLPASITVTVQPATSDGCKGQDFLNNKNTLMIAGNAGVSLSAQPTTTGTCIISYTATVDPSAPPGTYKLLLLDNSTPKQTLGSADLTVADPNAGPLPPGLNPGVDVIWEVMSQKKCGDVFGTRVAQSTYCIQLKVGNNSGYPLQIAGIGFSPDAVPATTGPDTTIANSSYASTRAVLIMENVTSGRNIAYNIINAIGVLMPAFAPYFGTFHPPSKAYPNGTVNNARVHWTTAASIVSGPLLQAFNIIAPNPVISQLNNLDDQSFRDNRVVANNTQIQTVVFVEKQQLTNQLIKLNTSAKAAMLTQQDWVDMGLKKSTSSMKSTITNSTNNRPPMFSTKGGFNPYYVKLALGNVVIVGRHIQYLDRVQVVNSATPVSGAAPIIKQVSPPNGVVGDTVTVSGSNFGASKGSSTAQFGSVSVTDFPEWTDTEIKVKVPEGVQPGNINVKVSASGGDSAPGTFTVKPGAPTLDKPSGAIGALITITGKNYGNQQGPSTVTFGIVQAPISGTWTATSIPVKVPPGVTGTVKVVVTVNGVSSDSADFNVSQ